MSVNQKYTDLQLAILVIARVLAGWNFLYEDFIKLLNPNWDVENEKIV